MKEKGKRKLATYSLDEKVIEDFIIVSTINKEQMSTVVERLIRDYIITNKANVNEMMLNYWKNNIDE
jgi:hypothetical protein